MPLHCIALYFLQVFGVCCNNTLPEELPEESSEEDSSEENDAVVDENDDFTIEGLESRSSCGFRAVFPKPQVTLYNQSPNPAPFFYQNIVQPYIVNGQEAIPHEYPFMVNNMIFFKTFLDTSSNFRLPC